MHSLHPPLPSPKVSRARRLVSLGSLAVRIPGTKREAELDDVSPSKLKALKAARNGHNGEAPADDDSSNHKNGDEHVHDDDDEDDDDVRCNIVALLLTSSWVVFRR